MAEESGNSVASGAPKTSWWSTLPGILTAAAAVITALSGLLAILAQNGVFGESNKPIATKAADVVVSSSVAPKTSIDDKPSQTKPVEAAPKAGASSGADGAASGIAAAPLHSLPFTGAIITRLDGSIVKLRDDIKEYCQGAPLLKTPDGQLIEMKRMARFDVVDWNDQAGTVRITLNNGETVETRINACAMRGTNDLGEFHGDFSTIKSVVFVR
jgi:hypothetical protein